MKKNPWKYVAYGTDDGSNRHYHGWTTRWNWDKNVWMSADELTLLIEFSDVGCDGSDEVLVHLTKRARRLIEA